jgi:hypothetical protein
MAKEGFEEAIKAMRKELGIPVEKGFSDSLQLANFIINKLTKAEKETLSLLAFLEYYELENGVDIREREDFDKLWMVFNKKMKRKVDPVINLHFLQMRIDDHNNFITKSHYIGETKSLAKIFNKEFAIFKKFFGIDLLDEHIIMQFIERYLFLGQRGVSEYIKQKVTCSACRHIGIAHFSAVRQNMEGQDEGPYSGKYIFNKDTVKMLSTHFNSVFLIIKPYATKEQAIQYVEDNWEHMKEHMTMKNSYYKQFDVHPSIKESEFERNQLVYELNKLPKKELLGRYKGEKDLSLPGVYKESIISGILWEQHGIEMSSDAVKKAAARFARDTKLQGQRGMKDIKDIRDI